MKNNSYFFPLLVLNILKHANTVQFFIVEKILEVIFPCLQKFTTLSPIHIQRFFAKNNSTNVSISARTHDLCQIANNSQRKN